MKKLNLSVLKKSVTLYISIAMLVLTVLAVILTASIQRYSADMQEEDYSRQIDRGIEYAIKNYVHNYGLRMRRMIENENVIELIKSRDRDGLYTLFKEKWEMMIDEDENLKIMHFHLPDGRSFLRLHKPELFGDNLSDIRPMIKAIHTSHKKIEAYETGKLSNAYRIVIPIFDKNREYLGAFEIGLNPRFILNRIREINSYDGMVFVKENSLFQLSVPGSTVIDEYKLDSKLSSRLEKIFELLKREGRIENEMELNVGNSSYKTHLFVLNDYSGKPSVKIIYFQDITDFKIFHGYFPVILLATMSIILAGLILLVHRRMGFYEKELTAIYENQIDRLYKSEHRFELLYDKGPEAYQSLDEDGNIVAVNERWLDDLEYKKEEVVGKYFGDFLTPQFSEEFIIAFEKFKETGRVSAIEFDMMKKNGEIISISLNGVVLKNDSGELDETYCVWSNITERKNLRDRLISNEKYLQGIFDANRSMMIMSNGNSIEKVNPAMLEFFGYATLEDFNAEHSCICDFFLEDENCIQADVNGENWLEYIIERENELHKVCMLKDNKKHYFILQVSQLQIDEKKRSVIVLSDVSELEEVSKRLEYAVNGTNDGLWAWDLNTNEVYFSPRWKSMLGYEDHELVNEFATWQDRVHPDDLERTVKELLETQKEPNIKYKGIHRLRHKDGHWVWILDRGQTIFDENGKAVQMFGFHTDISEQKELENELRSSQHQFEQFMEYIPATVMIKDEKQRIVYANKRAAEFFKQKQMVGKTAKDLLPPQLSDKIDEIDRLILTKGIHEEVLETFDDKGEKSVYRNLGFKIVGDRGVNIGIVSIDITHEYRLKEDLNTQEELLIAQSRHAAMGEMISMIAHQWRQPISVIAMDANNILADIELEMLEEKSLKDTAKDIIEHTQELSRTIDDFRNFFRPEKEAQEVLLNELFNDALGVIGKALESSRVELVVNIDENIKVTTYARELMQVFINIIKNAKEALVDNKIENKKISVFGSEDNENLTLRICDNAGGVSEENMEKIFNPYFTTKGVKNGTGLGLYMSKTIVEKHLLGSLSVENDEEGACFEITIPFTIKAEEN